MRCHDANMRLLMGPLAFMQRLASPVPRPKLHGWTCAVGR